MGECCTICRVLKVTGVKGENVIMGVGDGKYGIYGLEYDGEWIVSEYGEKELNLLLREVGVKYGDWI